MARTSLKENENRLAKLELAVEELSRGVLNHKDVLNSILNSLEINIVNHAELRQELLARIKDLETKLRAISKK